MKFTVALSTLAVLLAATIVVDAAPQGGNGIQVLKPAKVTPKGQNLKFGNKSKGKQNAGAADAASSSAAAAASNDAAASTAAAASATDSADAAAATGDAAAAAADQAANASADDLQSSLTLDPGQVQPGLANDGQAVPTAGQIASLTSTNNFINYCATRPDLPLTNGQQILTGSCNPTIMGEIVAKDKMPSAKITNPPNFSTVKAGETVSFKIAVKNMNTGNFVNAQQNYFAAPQTTDQNGILVAHSHITVNAISDFQDTTATDPQDFVFFKGLNDPAVDGVLSADAVDGFKPGFFRACTINSAANHQPALVAVAQHASLDDCTYFQVTDDGNADGAAADAAAASATDAAAASATDAAAASATDSAAAAAATDAGNNDNNSNDIDIAAAIKKAKAGKSNKSKAKGGNNRRRFSSSFERRR
ncbi:hypothetical protein EXIGLDRAFT_725005 [Exidia glandulosa HHB12029]|uniref:Uncharacterized protein n=1 Tax=Exidia glandulosa HHB12029 TaxID=1314781 RepID=A0A166BAZ3_EXIGL|nr:hypothetical protein EXIGLDRAFT_725005 [Exidia glandulosa HHB12029]